MNLEIAYVEFTFLRGSCRKIDDFEKAAQAMRKALEDSRDKEEKKGTGAEPGVSASHE